MSQYFTYDDMMFPKSCVYILFLAGEPKWVGQTVNLPMRLHQHKTERAFDSVWWHPVDADKLNYVEAYLIKSIRPSDNRYREGCGYGPSHAQKVSDGLKRWAKARYKC